MATNIGYSRPDRSAPMRWATTPASPPGSTGFLNQHGRGKLVRQIASGMTCHHRIGYAGRPQSLCQSCAGFASQLEIQQGNIDRLGLDQRNGGLRRRGGADDGMPRLLECPDVILGDQPFVFDDQEFIAGGLSRFPQRQRRAALPNLPALKKVSTFPSSRYRFRLDQGQSKAPVLPAPPTGGPRAPASSGEVSPCSRPDSPEPCPRFRQRAIFGGIGRQFVHHHAQR